MTPRSRTHRLTIDDTIDDTIDVRDVSTPLAFAEVVVDPMTPPQVLVETILVDGLAATADWPADPLLDPWRAVLEPLVALDRPQTYIGTFRAAVNRSAAIASELPDRDRAAVALLLFECTATRATTHQDVVFGIRAAQRLDPVAFDSRQLLPLVVESFQRGGEPSRLGLGLPAVLEIIAGAPERVFQTKDLWALSAALAPLPESVRQGLPALLAPLHPDDRRTIQDLLAPHRRRRRFRRHRR